MNTTALTKPFLRLSNQPLDITAVFHSYSQMYLYAKENPTAIHGQIVSVIGSNGYVDVYKLTQETNPNLTGYKPIRFITTDGIIPILKAYPILQEKTLANGEIMMLQNLIIRDVTIHFNSSFVGNATLKLGNEIIAGPDEIMPTINVDNYFNLHRAVVEETAFKLEATELLDQNASKATIYVTTFTYNIEPLQ